MVGSLMRWGLLATLLGGSAVALVGSDKARLYFKSGKDSVMSALNDIQGLESRLGLIHTQIGGLDDEVRDLKRQAVRHKVEMERLREGVAARETALDKQAVVLERVSDLLDQGSAEYTIGRTIYTRNEVERDATEKLSIYNVQAETLRSLKETLATKENAAVIAEENVSRAEALRVELQAKVGLLEAQLEKFRAREAFAATVENYVSTEEIDSDLARAREMIREFEEELEVKDRMLEEQLRNGPEHPSSGIDYEAVQVEGQDLSLQIRRALFPDEAEFCTVANEPALSLAVAVDPAASH